MNEVEIVVKSLDKTNFKSVSDAPKKIGRDLGGLKSAIIGLGIGSLLVGEFKGATAAAEDANRIGRETTERLKSTGASAWTTAAAISGLAAKEAEKVGVDDDLIQGGENMLLTFQGVRNEVGRGNDIFNQATKTALDLAAGMNHGKIEASGLQTANIQLGKALQDPIKGIGALTKIGVTFTAQQKEQLKDLVKHHDLLGAQKIILKAVGDQFGGTAEASATAMGKMSAKIGNLQERIGNLLLPVLDRAATLLGKTADFISRNADAIVPLIGVVGTIIGLWKAWTMAQAALDAVMAANPIGLVIIAIAALAAGIVVAYRRSETFRTIVQGVFRAVQSSVGNAIGAMITAFRFMLNVWLTVAGGILHGAAVAFGWIPGIGGKLRAADAAFQTFKNNVLGKLEDIANQAFGWGARLGASYAGGLTSKQAQVAQAAGSLAGIVKTHMKTGSPAEAGPLHDFPPDVMGEGVARNFAEGLQAGRRGVGGALGSLLAPAAAVARPVAPSGPSGGVVRLEIHSAGSRFDDALLELLRRSIRVRGGDVQVVLGT